MLTCQPARRALLALLLITTGALAAPVGADAAPGRLAGSLSFDRSYDKTERAGDISQRLVREDHWTITLPEEASPDPNNIGGERYEATITGTITFRAETVCGASCQDSDTYVSTGSWSGSGRAIVTTEPVYPQGPGEPTHWDLTVWPEAGTGLPGSQSGDAQFPSSDPMPPEVIATFNPGEEASRTVSACLPCRLRRVSYAGVPDPPQYTTAPALDTRKLQLRERADVAVSVEPAGETGEDGIVETVAHVVNRGPDAARGVVLADALEQDGVVVSAKPSRGSCRTAGRSATCAIGGLAAGASADVVMKVRVAALSVPTESEGPPAGTAALRPAYRVASTAGVTPGPTARSTRRSTASAATRDPDTSNNAAKQTTKSKCVGRLRAGPVTLRAGCWRKASKNLWVSKSAVSYNGLTITAPGRLAVNVKALTFAASGTATVKAGKITLYRGEVDYKLKKDLKFEVASGAKLKGLPIKGTLKGSISPGKIAFTATVELPSVLGGASAASAFSTQDGSGLRLDTLKVKVKRVKVGGKLKVEDIALTYTRSSDEWSARAKVFLPSPKAPTVTGRLTLRGGRFKSLSADAGGINRPLAYGIFLQSIGFGVAVEPLTLDGRMTLTAGPKVLGKAAATTKGTMHYRDGTYSIAGETKLVKSTLSSAKLTYTTPSSVTIAGKVDQRIGGFGLTARMNGWIDGSRAFQIDGASRISAPGPDARGAGLISHRGIGVCGPGPFGIQLGWRYKWGDKLPRPGCDLGAVQARASQAGDGVSLPAGLSQALIAVRGAGAAPLVRVTGPDGRSVDVVVSGPDAAVVQEPFLAYRIDEEATTYVFIGRPAPGRWTVAALPGTAPIAGIASEVGLPAPKVRARVKAGKRRATLTWRLRAIPGQRVTFAEQAGDVNRVIGSTSQARGRLRFRPAAGSRRRTITAYVDQDGMPRAELPVARFRARPR